ncbi:hypothetical protein V6N12_061770 [Hibiscus sabdariffa]|uniref:Uncharacterized protein n=1 Tax=Hibiscus sabdariffa TaxID=183260 RepID=A0ABR2DY13_9ROSI
MRQHWFISRLDGASITAGGFPPQDRNVLIITTSSNQFYIFDVEARQLGEWSMAMRSIDFGKPVEEEDENELVNGALLKFQGNHKFESLNFS